MKQKGNLNKKNLNNVNSKSVKNNIHSNKKATNAKGSPNFKGKNEGGQKFSKPFNKKTPDMKNQPLKVVNKDKSNQGLQQKRKADTDGNSPKKAKFDRPLPPKTEVSRRQMPVKEVFAKLSAFQSHHIDQKTITLQYATEEMAKEVHELLELPTVIRRESTTRKFLYVGSNYQTKFLQDTYNPECINKIRKGMCILSFKTEADAKLVSEKKVTFKGMPLQLFGKHDEARRFRKQLLSQGNEQVVAMKKNKQIKDETAEEDKKVAKASPTKKLSSKGEEEEEEDDDDNDDEEEIMETDDEEEEGDDEDEEEDDDDDDEEEEEEDE